MTHFYSSEFYGEHMSKALGAVNRLVDSERNTWPVSGTLIRSNPYANRQYLDPIVYRDLVTSVVFLGAPSTGKTTLAQALAKKYKTVWMPEYGREYWEKHQVNQRLTLEQLMEIAEGHLEREEALYFEANKYLFVDTNAITTYMFSRYYHGTALPGLSELSNQAASRYDVVFLCEDDIPYDDTWDRSGETNRSIFQQQIIVDLIERKISFVRLKGSLEERFAMVTGILEKYKEYDRLRN